MIKILQPGREIISINGRRGKILKYNSDKSLGEIEAYDVRWYWWYSENEEYGTYDIASHVQKQVPRTFFKPESIIKFLFNKFLNHREVYESDFQY